MTATASHLDTWTAFLTGKDIPVMRSTVKALDVARKRLHRIGVRDIADIVLKDPLMTLRVLRFVGLRRGKRQEQELANVEHAIIMIGVEPFFHHFARHDIVEDQLKPHPQALLGLLRLVQRARRSARYALDWAAWRQDLNCEEIAAAALMQDIAAMLVHALTPNKAAQLDNLGKTHPQASAAQRERAVLGTTLAELHARLCREWKLSALLASLDDPGCAAQPRVRNVRLARDLAMHAAGGWDDPAIQPALEQDFQAIAALMSIDDATLRLRLGLQPRKAVEPDTPEEPRQAPGQGT
ncbi:HDOD domain-containing protein [Noviherbaspirillum galbum]|uniref:HDOD domain-containing protein n=1 Tax=Noviherbaspirillum galbum TaxID=2709383 RepID=A0A6B3SMG3_9BURK|nr:HDOD domain-containing protein [Noviherbaspirillum galbum]NEX60515.1 HDOD domain-containing protein [Noviherbaspirillum galbum]